jgi:hypothetical protein
MSGVTKSALRVYAALSELRRNDEDILDALVPFFEPILEIRDHERKDIRPPCFCLWSTAPVSMEVYEGYCRTVHTAATTKRLS